MEGITCFQQFPTVSVIDYYSLFIKIKLSIYFMDFYISFKNIRRFELKKLQKQNVYILEKMECLASDQSELLVKHITSIACVRRRSLRVNPLRLWIQFSCRRHLEKCITVLTWIKNTPIRYLSSFAWICQLFVHWWCSYIVTQIIFLFWFGRWGMHCNWYRKWK